METLGIWVGLNLFLTLMLALNVTRIRVKLGVGIGSGESEQLDRAIRAHGNNIEYTPLALLGLAILASTGLLTSLSTFWEVGCFLEDSYTQLAYRIQRRRCPFPE